jgi:uncharacterized protein YjbJ (UPF0337 family)
MNWEQAKVNGSKCKGPLKNDGASLPIDDLEFIAGKRDELVGRIQERYGISKEEAQNQIDNWKLVTPDPAAWNEGCPGHRSFREAFSKACEGLDLFCHRASRT